MFLVVGEGIVALAGDLYLNRLGIPWWYWRNGIFSLPHLNLSPKFTYGAQTMAHAPSLNKDGASEVKRKNVVVPNIHEVEVIFDDRPYPNNIWKPRESRSVVCFRGPPKGESSYWR